MGPKQAVGLAWLTITTVFLLSAGWELGILGEHRLGPFAEGWYHVLIATCVAALSMLFPAGLLVGHGRRRARTEQSLTESEQRFRDFAESASDGLWETDADLKYTNIWGPLLNGLPDDAPTPLGKTR